MTDESEGPPSDWPDATPILARLMKQLGEQWPHYRVTDHCDEHGREYTLIEWGDNNTGFDPTAPGDFVSFVSDRPEPPDSPSLEADTDD